jgi:hypothetical protein
MLHNNTRKFLSINALIVLATTMFCGPSLADSSMKGWMLIAPNGSNVLEGSRFSLYNTDQAAFLRYKNRTGANLGWSKNPNDFMKFRRESPSAGSSGGAEPLKCEETIALYAEKEWLIYEKQTFGINISTRSKIKQNESFQWKFTNCGASGSTINLNQPISLVNIRTGTAVVGCERTVGVNLCWAEDVATHSGKNYRIEDLKSLYAAGKIAAGVYNALLRR